MRNLELKRVRELGSSLTLNSYVTLSKSPSLVGLSFISYIMGIRIFTLCLIVLLGGKLSEDLKSAA